MFLVDYVSKYPLESSSESFYRAIKVEIVLVFTSFIVCLFEIVKFRDSSENAWAWFHREAHKNLEKR